MTSLNNKDHVKTFLMNVLYNDTNIYVRELCKLIVEYTELVDYFYISFKDYHGIVPRYTFDISVSQFIEHDTFYQFHFPKQPIVYSGNYYFIRLSLFWFCTKIIDVTIDETTVKYVNVQNYTLFMSYNNPLLTLIITRAKLFSNIQKYIHKQIIYDRTNSLLNNIYICKSFFL